MDDRMDLVTKHIDMLYALNRLTMSRKEYILKAAKAIGKTIEEPDDPEEFKEILIQVGEHVSEIYEEEKNSVKSGLTRAIRTLYVPGVSNPKKVASDTNKLEIREIDVDVAFFAFEKLHDRSIEIADNYIRFYKGKESSDGK